MPPGGGAVNTEEKGFGWGRVAQGDGRWGEGVGRGREGYIYKEGDGGVYVVGVLSAGVGVLCGGKRGCYGQERR